MSRAENQPGKLYQLLRHGFKQVDGEQMCESQTKQFHLSTLNSRQVFPYFPRIVKAILNLKINVDKHMLSPLSSSRRGFIFSAKLRFI